jgi:hypothetical protein
MWMEITSLICVGVGRDGIEEALRSLMNIGL